MAEETIKPKLAALLKMGAEEQRAFIAGLSVVQRAQVGTSDKWSAKDILAHIALWQAYRVQEYQMLERGETPPELRGGNDGNEINFYAHRDQPWSEVIAAAESASIGILALLEGFSDAELTTPGRLPSHRNEPLWREFHGIGYVHPVFHYADFYAEHGEMARAAALHQRLAEGTASVGGDDSRGVADYNLACFYAKTGQKDLALALLPGALKLAPRLVEWSKEDVDLLSLHGETAYQALYA
jgi:hypothetical protein